jgi:hypothetical protein
MAGWKNTRARAYRLSPDVVRTQATLAALTAMAAAPLLALTALLPRPQVLPALCLLALAGAGVAALYAWWRNANRHAQRVTGWDVAGALVFIGCAAGMLSDAESILELFGHARLTR